MTRSRGLIFAVLLFALGGSAGAWLWDLFHSWPKTPTNSPVVVRGGTITIRTKEKSKGWQQIGNSYCTDTKASVQTITFDGTGQWLQQSAGVNPVTVSSGWILTVYGRVHPYNKNNPASQNGIQITEQAQSCAKVSGKTSLVLSLVGPFPGYYGDDGVTNEDSSGAVVTGKRFEDQTPNSCSGPNPVGSTGDEDACERASEILLVSGGTSNYYNCQNGECTIFVGP